MVPDQDASAVMGEIYSTLVVKETLSIELQTMEAAMVDGLNGRAALTQSIQATEEALLLAARERSQRQALASKVKVLQTERANASNVQEELEAAKASNATRERELKQALKKAQHASDRHMNSMQCLKVERSLATKQRRQLAVQRLGSALAFSSWAAAQRAFFTWSAKVATGLFDVVPNLPQPPSSGRDRSAENSLSEADSQALGLHREAMAAYEEENHALRARLAEMVSHVSVAEAREQALRGAASRAALASSELLDARMKNRDLTNDLAAANAELQRLRAEGWKRAEQLQDLWDEEARAQQAPRMLTSPGRSDYEWFDD